MEWNKKKFYIYSKGKRTHTHTHIKNRISKSAVAVAVARNKFNEWCLKFSIIIKFNMVHTPTHTDTYS